jgi:hypothetical protein
MKTTENRQHWNLRKWIVPASLAAAMLFLPGAASSAEAHGHGHGYGHIKKAHKYHHSQAHKAANYAYKHFAPVRVSYYQPRVYRPVSFYLETPYVMVHGPRVDARVVYYPGEVPLYQPGYCPAAVHYHPYEDETRVNVSVQSPRVSVRVGF